MTKTSALRLFICLMGLLLAVTLLVACDSGKTPDETVPETVAPTEAPTEEPTEPPTEVPTEAPTEEPTEEVTTEPETEPAAESGCKSVTAGAFALVAMLAIAFVSKKKE